jgi:hypothetical protein
MTTRTLYTTYPEAAEFLKANDAKIMVVKNGDTTYLLPDGSVFQEHDQAGEPYSLSIVMGADQ